MTGNTPASERLTRVEALHRKSLRKPTQIDSDELGRLISDLKYGLDSHVESLFTAARVRSVAADTIRNMSLDSESGQRLVPYEEDILWVLESGQRELLSVTRAQEATGILTELKGAQASLLAGLRNIFNLSPTADKEEFLSFFPVFVTEDTPPVVLALYLLVIEWLIMVYDEEVIDDIGDLTPGLVNPDNAVRKETVDVLSEIAAHDSDTVERYLDDISSLLVCGDPDIEKSAAELCGELASEAPELVDPFAESLIETLDNDSFEVRAEGLKAVTTHPRLTHPSTEEVTAEVIDRLDDSDADFRRRAAWTLAECPSLFDPTTIPVEPLIEHQSHEEEEFVRAIHEIFCEIADEAPERLEPYLDTILDPPITNEGIKRVLIGVTGNKIAESDPALLGNHIDIFVSLALSRELQDEQSTILDKFFGRLRETAELSPQNLMSLDSMRVSHAFDMSYRHTVESSDYDVDTGNLDLFRAGALEVLGEIALSDIASEHLYEAIQGISSAILAESNLVQSRTIEILRQILYRRPKTTVDFIPLYIRGVNQSLDEGKIGTAREILILLSISSEATTEIEANVYTDGTFEQIVSLLGRRTQMGDELATVDHQLIAHAVRNATIGAFTAAFDEEADSTENLLGSIFDESYASDSTMSDELNEIQEAFSDYHRELLALADAPGLYTSESMLAIFNMISAGKNPPTTPYIEKVMSVLESVQIVEDTDRDIGRYVESIEQAMKTDSEVTSEKPQEYAEILSASSSDVIQTGMRVLKTTARKTPMAILPYVEPIRDIADSTKGRGRVNLYQSLAAVSLSMPNQCTSLVTLFVDGLYETDEIREISVEALVQLAENSPKSFDGDVASIAATLRTDSSVITILGASYILRLLAEADPEMTQDVESMVESITPVKAPASIQVRDDEDVSSSISQLASSSREENERLINEQLQAFEKAHERVQNPNRPESED